MSYDKEKRNQKRMDKVNSIDENKRLNRIVERRENRYNRQLKRAEGSLDKMSKLQKNKGYKYEEGIEPDETGHYSSIGDGGKILKAKRHPSMIKTKKAERLLGNKIVKIDGDMYSIPKSTNRKSLIRAMRSEND
jgi:hypothetical protein